MRHPLEQGRQLDRFLSQHVPADHLVANGDYSCDTGFVGVSDEAARQSAQECLGKLRSQYGDRARFVMGDHELGKFSTFGSGGGMRLASWRCATEQLGLQPFWQLAIGHYLLMGVNSSLIALPAHQGDALPEEWPEWLTFAGGASGRNPGRVQCASAGATRDFVLSRPHGITVSLARGIRATPAAAGGTDHHRPSAHQTDFVEKPLAVRHSARSIFWANPWSAFHPRCMRLISGGRSVCGYARHSRVVSC